MGNYSEVIQIELIESFTFTYINEFVIRSFESNKFNNCQQTAFLREINKIHQNKIIIYYRLH